MALSLSDWDALRADHRRAVRDFEAAAASIEAATWGRAPAEGKWSPGQIGEHLVLSYQAALRELGGGVGMRVRTTRWQRALIRFRYLGMILREGRLPAGAKAARELRPVGEPRPREAVVSELGTVAAQVDDQLTSARAAGRGGMTHFAFGRLGAEQALRFLTVHMDHHRKQLHSGGF